MLLSLSMIPGGSSLQHFDPAGFDALRIPGLLRGVGFGGDHCGRGRDHFTGAGCSESPKFPQQRRSTQAGEHTTPGFGTLELWNFGSTALAEP